jgi:hypothetical protein
VLISAQHLVDRLRHPRGRADDLLDVRRRLAALPGPAQVSEEQRALAAELLALRERFIELMGAVEACSGCAAGHPLPFGRWVGGHCCGGRTATLFTDDELAALKLAGTTPARLVAPDSDVAGCAFRGPDGCSLGARDRPNLCTRYLCRDLERELKQRGDLAPIAEIGERIRVVFERFARLRVEAAEDALPWP